MPLRSGPVDEDSTIQSSADHTLKSMSAISQISGREMLSYSHNERSPLKLYPAGLPGATREHQAHKGEWRRVFFFRRHSGVCVYVCLFYSCCGDMHLCTQSRCGDRLPFGDIKQINQVWATEMLSLIPKGQI